VNSNSLMYIVLDSNSKALLKSGAIGVNVRIDPT
jgi:hypothetical protein